MPTLIFITISIITLISISLKPVNKYEKGLIYSIGEIDTITQIKGKKK